MNPLVFPLLRKLSDGHFHSGETLARRFGVTRATVWNLIKQTEPLGVEVFSVRGKGYRLAHPLNFIDPAKVLAKVGDRAPISLDVLDVVDSTNSELMRHSQNAQWHGRCVAAEIQSAGRGRRGRPWVSGLGNSLTFSLLWRFNQGAAGLSGLSLAVGVALHRALSELGLAGIQLKWPNDVLYQQRKLAGILIELQGEMQGPSAAIIGVGINIAVPAALRQIIDQPMADLQEILGNTPDRSTVLGLALKHLAHVLSTFEQQGFATLREEWEQHHAFQHQPVSLLMPNGMTQPATVVGVAEDGCLLADAGQGVQRFSSVEISLRGAV